MAIWRRGSRRLVLVIWTIITFALLLRYRDTLSPSQIRLGKPITEGTTDHSPTSASTPPAPKAAKPPKKKTGLDSAKYFVKSAYDWSKLRRHHPIDEDDMVHLPKGAPKSLTRVQFAFPRPAFTLNAKQQAQQDAVRHAFKRAWDAYVEYGFPHDELAPVTLQGKDTFGGWAATMVDALDTLYIMGFHDEFDAMLPSVGAIDWSDTQLTSLNVFETNIRYLGGLLSAYDLSGEKVLLLKAIELGELLYAAFDTPNHMPPFWLDFTDAKKGSQRAGTNQPSASPGSLCLEFTRLAQITGDAKYYDAIDRIKRFLLRTQETTLIPGLWPVFLDFERELANTTSDFSLGAQADSLYEYLPKMTALLGDRDPAYEKMYRRAMSVASEHLLFRPMTPSNLDILFPGDAHARSDSDIESIPDGQHLSCFAGGMFGLGGKLYNIPAHLATAEKLARGCAWAYSAFPTGIMPETFAMLPCASRTKCEWNETRWAEEGDDRYPKGFKYLRDSRYMLRPEAIESVFLLYRMTGKIEYQEMAWDMFLAVQVATVTDKANSAIKDVNVKDKKTEKTDDMESFWLAETLKYFYLVFSPPDVVGLDEWVFNTEAHPLRRPV